MARRPLRIPTRTPPAADPRRRGILPVLLIGVLLGATVTFVLNRWLFAPTPEIVEAPPGKPNNHKKTDKEKSERPPTPSESVSPSPKAPRSLTPPGFFSPAPSPAKVKPPTALAPVVPTPPVSKNVTPSVNAPVVEAQRKPPVMNFHDILEGDKVPKPAPPVKPREVFWLQVAALRQEDDARRLRARLLLLNFDVEIQKDPDSHLYRVRVGPFKTIAQAREGEANLNRNNLTPRLLREPVFQ